MGSPSVIVPDRNASVIFVSSLFSGIELDLPVAVVFCLVSTAVSSDLSMIRSRYSPGRKDWTSLAAQLAHLTRQYFTNTPRIRVWSCSQVTGPAGNTSAGRTSCSLVHCTRDGSVILHIARGLHLLSCGDETMPKPPESLPPTVTGGD